jgi:hypothetical protein
VGERSWPWRPSADAWPLGNLRQVEVATVKVLVEDRGRGVTAPIAVADLRSPVIDRSQQGGHGLARRSNGRRNCPC